MYHFLLFCGIYGTLIIYMQELYGIQLGLIDSDYKFLTLIIMYAVGNITERILEFLNKLGG